MQKHSNKFLIGALIGSTVGALTTLLFKTQEGKKIQKKLMKKFHEMDEKTGHFGISTFLPGHGKITDKLRQKSKSKRTR